MQELLITLISMLFAGLVTLSVFFLREKNRLRKASKNYVDAVQTTEAELDTLPKNPVGPDPAVESKLARLRAKYDAARRAKLPPGT